jgi:hypothetical protein
MRKDTVTAISKIFIQLALGLFVFAALIGVSEAQIKIASIQSTSAVSSQLNHLLMTAMVRVPKSETMLLGEEMFLSATVRAAKKFVKINEQSQMLDIETMSAARPNVDYKVQAAQHICIAINLNRGMPLMIKPGHFCQ